MSPTQRRIRLAFGAISILAALAVICAPRVAIADAGDRHVCGDAPAEALLQGNLSKADSQDLQTYVGSLDKLAKKKTEEWHELSEDDNAGRENLQNYARAICQAYSAAKRLASQIHPRPKDPSKPCPTAADRQADADRDAMTSALRGLRESVDKLLCNVGLRQTVSDECGGSDCCDEVADSCLQKDLSNANSCDLLHCLRCLQDLTDKTMEKWKALGPSDKVPSKQVQPTPSPTPAETPCQADKALEETPQTREGLQTRARSIYETYQAVKWQERRLRKDAKNSSKCHPDDKVRARQEKTDRELMESDLRTLRGRVHALLAEAGLWQPISAQLVTGLINGAVPSQSSPAGTGGTLPAGYLEFASRRVSLHDKRNVVGERRLDANLGGRFGFVPALSLLPAAPTATPAPGAASSGTDSSPTARLQQAFIWEAGGMVNLHLASVAEVSLIAQGGQTNADSRSSIQGTGSNASLVVPLSGNSDFRWHWRAGLRARVFSCNQTPEYVQELNGLVAPALEVSVFYKRENRFGDKNGTIVPESGWPRRLAFGLMLNSIPVINAGSVLNKSTQFTISIGVEYEGRWPWNHDQQNVPAVTRLIIHGDLDLLKFLKGGS